jgi:hypothetical protein
MDQTFPYDLAAVDLDDTLLGPDKLISSANRAAVRALRAFGVEVVLASGPAVGQHDSNTPAWVSRSGMRSNR